MARLARLYAPSIVQHVVQRPADGRVLFIDDDDYRFFIRSLADAVRASGVALHAYVLLPSQVRLLATPKDAASIGRVMQSIGRHYVPRLNRKAARGGPLWDRRYRSTLIDADEYLLPSMLYVERAPVRDGFAATPDAWRWSSHAHHVGREQQPFVVDHARYWALSDTPFERQAMYRGLHEGPRDASVETRIGETVDQGWILGDAAFVARLEARVNRRGAKRPRGRPRKADESVPVFDDTSSSSR